MYIGTMNNELVAATRAIKNLLSDLSEEDQREFVGMLAQQCGWWCEYDNDGQMLMYTGLVDERFVSNDG